MLLTIKMEDISPPKRFHNSSHQISKLQVTLAEALEKDGYAVPEHGGWFQVYTHE